MPDLIPLARATGSLRDDLVNEVAIVNTRVHGIELSVPDYRPNTQRALAMLLSAEEHCPDVAAEMRMALFRTLWRDNRDISDPQVLQTVAEIFSDELGSEFSDYNSSVAAHTEEWREYDRIPALKSPTGATYLGLGDKHALSIFMGSALFDMEREYACYPKDSSDQ